MTTWTPTHTIPESGLPARSEPNASLEPLQRIRHGVEVALMESTGGWARIQTDTGWEAWVDGTRLVEIAGAPAPAAAPTPPPPAPTAAPAPTPEPEPEVAAAPEPAPMAAWEATHTVPDGGLPAREKADPGLEPLLRIQSGTGVRVVETVGAWSRIDIESGWGAWVDHRRLSPIGEAAAESAPEPDPAPQPAPDPKPAPQPEPEPEPVEITATHTIVEKGAPAREAPDGKSKQVARLAGGTEVEATGTEGSWSSIRTGDGTEAWVSNRSLDAIGEPADAAAPSAAAQPTAAGTGWAATHTIPDGGLPAREKADPSLDPLLRIQSGTGVQVAETAGAWSRVTIESGWEAWVDNRRLIPIGGSAPAPIPAPEPEPEPEVWERTHVIPDGGLSAWSEPKADKQPILKVKSGTEVQVVGTAGAWSQIRTEPGWEAWVDGRRLVEKA